MEGEITGVKIAVREYETFATALGLWPEFKRGNKLIRDYIRQQDNPDLAYVDIGEVMLDKTTGVADSTIFINDLLHMNAEGYDRWEAVIYPEIKRILNYKDEQDEVFAMEVVKAVFPEEYLREQLSSYFPTFAAEIAASLPVVEPSFWTKFLDKRVAPNIDKVINFTYNDLISQLSMADIRACSEALINKKENNDDPVFDKIAAGLQQTGQKTAIYFQNAVVDELAKSNHLSRTVTTKECETLRQGEFYNLSANKQDTVYISRTTGEQIERFGGRDFANFKMEWTEDCTYTLLAQKTNTSIFKKGQIELV